MSEGHLDTLSRRGVSRDDDDRVADGLVDLEGDGDRAARAEAVAAWEMDELEMEKCKCGVFSINGVVTLCAEKPL